MMTKPETLLANRIKTMLDEICKVDRGIFRDSMTDDFRQQVANHLAPKIMAQWGEISLWIIERSLKG